MTSGHEPLVDGGVRGRRESSSFASLSRASADLWLGIGGAAAEAEAPTLCRVAGPSLVFSLL